MRLTLRCPQCERKLVTLQVSDPVIRQLFCSFFVLRSHMNHNQRVTWLCQVLWHVATHIQSEGQAEVTVEPSPRHLPQRLVNESH